VNPNRSAGGATIATRVTGAWLLAWASGACWVGIGALIGLVVSCYMVAGTGSIDLVVAAVMVGSGAGMVVAIPFAVASAVVSVGLVLQPFDLSIRGTAAITSIANGVIGAVGTLAFLELSTANSLSLAVVLAATGAGVAVGVPLGIGVSRASTSRTTVVDEALQDLIRG
jgi:hypothetical protein